MSARVLLAGLFHETHTFLDGTTPLDAFEIREGAELLTARGDGSPIDGFLEVAERHRWQVVPTIDMRATPSATVEDEALEAYWRVLREHLSRAVSDGFDALFLVLHGAMASASFPDVEGEVLTRIAHVLGSQRPPIFGVFDLHANVSERMVCGADALVAYRENPHTDAREAAVRAAEWLARALHTGVRPHMALRHAGVLWPPTGTGTRDAPMSTLEALARQFEAQVPGLWAANVVAGFSFADTPDTGVSFVTAGTCTRDVMDGVLRDLADMAWQERSKGNRVDPPVAEVLDRILPLQKGPFVIAEPSDNIGGGAPGDGTGLLRALLERSARSALVVLADPAAVEELQTAPIGALRNLALGGRGSSLDPGPVTLEVELLSRSDGRFTLEDPHSHLASMTGLYVDMGPCAVVRHGGITILLTSRKTPPFDLGQLRSQGLEPSRFEVIGVKAAVAHRQAYDKIAVAHYSVDTPGPCSSDLTRYPYRLLRRPIYPLDAARSPRPSQAVPCGGPKAAKEPAT